MAANEKVRAVVVERAYSHCFAQEDVWGRRYFIHRNNVSRVSTWGWDDLQTGSVVELLPNEAPRGWEGLEVRVVER